VVATTTEAASCRDELQIDLAGLSISIRTAQHREQRVRESVQYITRRREQQKCEGDAARSVSLFITFHCSWNYSCRH